MPFCSLVSCTWALILSLATFELEETKLSNKYKEKQYFAIFTNVTC